MTETLTRTVTREQWLEQAVELLTPIFAEHDIELPAVRVSCGWPSRGGTSTKKKVVGQCWKSIVAADGVQQIFISPAIGGDVVQMLGILMHELIHAVDDCESGHKGAFGTMARKVGLEGKLTATIVGEESALADQLRRVRDELGEYPHSPLNLVMADAKKQTTRMLKVVCPEDGYTVRTTRKWLEVGTPTCPCGEEMVEDEA